jgi:hypothetical protein
VGADEIAAETDRAEALRAAHERLLNTRGFQFDFPPQPKPPEPAPWLEDLLELLASLGPAFQWLFWIALAVAAAGLLWFIFREAIAARWPGRGARKPKPASVEWRPTETQARLLLADADALAAEGRFAEAARLLLHRSVEDIRERRPRLVRPALTSRDIAAHPDLPGAARQAFAAIARVVERGVFAARPVGAADWTEARTAYQTFALPGALA